VPPPDLERTAYSIECFLNALRINDGPERTSTEEWLVRWLTGSSHKQGDCVLYRKSRIECLSGGKVVKSFAVPEVKQSRTIWCDGNKLSVIDGEEFTGTGKLVMLGTAGLLLAMPGMVAASTTGGKKDKNTGENSNNNNNNNNNNNG
jgi:hypothetical protein